MLATISRVMHLNVVGLFLLAVFLTVVVITPHRPRFCSFKGGST